jgi:hypothetical protein
VTRITFHTNKQTILLEKLTDPRLVKKYPPFYGTLRFVTPFTTLRTHKYQANAYESLKKDYMHVISWCRDLLNFQTCLSTEPGHLIPPTPSTLCYKFTIHCVLCQGIQHTARHYSTMFVTQPNCVNRPDASGTKYLTAVHINLKCNHCDFTQLIN